MNTFSIFKHILNVGIRVAFADIMDKNIADTIGTLLGRMDALKRAKCVRRYHYPLLFSQNIWMVIKWQNSIRHQKCYQSLSLLFRTRLRLMESIKNPGMN